MPFGTPRPLDWEIHGRDWPHRTHSRFVDAGGVRWHVQVMGEEAAPAILLLHGTGASTHSFRKMAPLLAARFRVIACDLPGHGFTVSRGTQALSLPGMAASVNMLVQALEIAPRFACGHSAGAAVLIRMALDGHLSLERLFGINSALKPIRGNTILSPLAKVLFANPLVPRAFSFQARHCDTTGGLLRATGSRLSNDDKRLYEILMRNPAHASGALGMMARWDVTPLISALPTLTTPLTLIVAEEDRMVSPATSRRAAALAPNSEVISFAQGGHLLHEVDPEGVTKVLLERM